MYVCTVETNQQKKTKDMITLTTDKNIEILVIEEVKTNGKLAKSFKKLLCVKRLRGKKQFLAGQRENGTVTILCDMI